MSWIIIILWNDMYNLWYAYHVLEAKFNINMHTNFYNLQVFFTFTPPRKTITFIQKRIIGAQFNI